MSKPPTHAQLVTLREIAAGEVRIRNPGSAPRIDGASPQVVGRCISLRYARWPRGGLMDGEVCELTDSGREILLAELPKRPEGWYWVEGDGDGWQPARYTAKGWEPAFSASTAYFTDDEIGVIGPMMAEPAPRARRPSI